MKVLEKSRVQLGATSTNQLQSKAEGRMINSRSTGRAAHYRARNASIEPISFGKRKVSESVTLESFGTTAIL